ncbi:enoyl-[acyl-carrier protein] reductase II [Amorphus suaedae]
MRIETALTRRLGIDLPIVQAGMSWASSCAALPLAVSRAGGLGVIAAGPMYEDALVRAIDDVRAGTDRPFAVNMPLYRQGAERVLDLLAEARVPVLVASQGGPKKYLDRFKALGTVCIHVVASVEHAVKAAAAGVDALVVVGGEAGGHPPPDLVSTLVLARAVVKAVADVPVIASGGFADGAGLAAALSLGAGAANFGTRFIATPEATVSDAYKRMIVEAGPSATRTVGRDVGMIRALANEFTDAMQALELSGADVATRKDRFQQSSLKMAALDGDVATGKVEAGQSAGLVDEIAPAGEVVRRIAEEYLAVVRGLPLPVDAHV